MVIATRFSVAGASLVLGLIAAAASAVPITVNQTAAAVNETNPVGGTTLATFASPFATSNYKGTVVAQVISGDTSNPYGGLTFTYQLSNSVTSANALTRLNITGYTAYATDMSYKLGTGNIAPTTLDRAAGIDVVGFAFIGAPIGSGVITAGQSTELLVVQTNALSFTFQQANISNGAVSQITTYAPAGAITPEPATLAAIAGGSLLLGRRRRA